jgi:TatD DNase family protein
MIFESHAHYDDKKFTMDREAILKKVKDAGVGIIINASASMKSSRQSLELAKNHEMIYTSVGVHPHDVQEMKESDLELLIAMSIYEKVVAIGEIGLDYYYDTVPHEIQKLWFRQQIKLAVDLDLPMIVHSRDASKDTYDLLYENKGHKVGGVIHCFSGSVATAKKYVALGYYLGIGGVVTFNNAKKLIEVVKEIPLEHLLIETDAPYLAPLPHRGQRNDSSMLPLVVQKIAEIKEIDPEEVERVTWENGMKLFRLES